MPSSSESLNVSPTARSGLPYRLSGLYRRQNSSGQSGHQQIYLPGLGVNLEGQKELLGMWLSENEGAKFWLGVLTELQNHGVTDIMIICIDGLKGFLDAIAAVYPHAQIQLCIVHMVRNSVKYVPWKDYKLLTTDLKRIYQSATEDEALRDLEDFSERWDEKYPQISRS